MPNRLAAETSPYLRQHAGNPVDWWPWCDEAFDAARDQDRPVLLSVGYSACHWCHVMAHECFEDPEIAALMNDLFVSIKVDREERPDVDGIYMQAVQAMTGGGGWPMTVFCTPWGVPYAGGTYFPPEDRGGMRGFPHVLEAAARAYHSSRDAVDRTGEQLRQALAPLRLPAGDDPARAQVDRACRKLVQETDRRWGGFGGAPKFPHAAALDLMLRRFATSGDRALYDAAAITLDRMARGGVYDQVGGGFHRYSVDAQWAVPHFEKMLYDNAQLAPVYLHAWQLTGESEWRRVCEQTLDYMLNEMVLPGGGFASSQDADTPDGEGAFFVWTPDQLLEALGEEDATLAGRLFGVAAGGNVEGGATVLSLPYPLDQVAVSLRTGATALRERLDGIRARLYEVRLRRPRPGRDDKVLTSWNALAVGAFAEAGAALDRADYLGTARAGADLLLRELVREGRVLRTWLDGEAKITGFLEDVAFLADALLTVYEATGEAAYFVSAQDLCQDMVGRFHDPSSGFSDTAIDAEPLLVRPRTLDDTAIPAGQSIAARALLRLAAFTGESRWREVALQTIRPLAEVVVRSPIGLANLAWALDLATSEVREVAVAGSPDWASTRSLVEVVQHRFDPHRVLAWGRGDSVPLMEGREPVRRRAAAYVCRNFACEAPVTDPARLEGLLTAR